MPSVVSSIEEILANFGSPITAKIQKMLVLTLMVINNKFRKGGCNSCECSATISIAELNESVVKWYTGPIFSETLIHLSCLLPCSDAILVNDLYFWCVLGIQ